MNAVDRRFLRALLVLPSVVGCAIATVGTVRAQEPSARAATRGEERPILVGVVSKAELRKPPFTEWFESQYSRYEPKAVDVERLRSSLSGVSVEAYFGTWCGDSRRQLPRVVKLLELAGVEDTRLSLVALSDRPMEFKQAPGNPQAKRYVHRTPTFVFVRGGLEIGRIVETPFTSLEADLLAIAEGKGRAPRYAAEAWVNRLVMDLPVAQAEKALEEAGPQVLALGDPDTLWHYAEQDLLRNGRAREAKAVLDLHLRLYPRSVVGYILLSDALVAVGRRPEAITAIDRALAIEPANARALRAAEKLRAP